MKVFPTFDTSLRWNLLILFTAGLLFWSSLTSVLATLPLYIQDIGATQQQIGLVMGCFAIGLLIFRPWVGQLADRHSRKLVLLIGMGVAAVAPLGYPLVHSIPLLMVLRAFHGVSIAAFTTGYSALVADIAPAKHRGEIIGYMGLVVAIGMAIGPALGGYLQATVGYLPLFLSTAGLGFVGLFCTAQVSNPPTLSQGQKTTTDLRFWQLLISPRVRVPSGVLLLVGLAFGAIITFVPLFIKSLGVDLNAGLFYTAAALAGLTVRLIVGQASDRYGRGLFITISLVFYTLSMLCLCFVNSASVFLLAAILEGAGGGILYPMTSAMMADRALPQERGRIFSVCLLGSDVGVGIAGPILGLVAEQVGYRSMFGFSAGLTALACLIFLTQSSKDLHHSLRFALGRGPDVYVR